MMTLGPLVGKALLILATAMGGTHDTGDCAKLSAAYKTIAAAVADADSAYRACVAASRGRGDCASEYGDLDLAAARFEAMVSDYLKVCRRGGGWR